MKGPEGPFASRAEGATSSIRLPVGDAPQGEGLEKVATFSTDDVRFLVVPRRGVSIEVLWPGIASGLDP